MYSRQKCCTSAPTDKRYSSNASIEVKLTKYSKECTMEFVPDIKAGQKCIIAFGLRDIIGPTSWRIA